MSPKRAPLAALFLCAVGWAEAARALPVISVFPEVVGGFEVDTIRPIPGFDHTVNHPGPVMVRVNVKMEIHDLDPQASPPQIGFSNVAYHVNFGGLERATAPFPKNYIPNVPTVVIDTDANHDCTELDCIPIPIWDFNADDGLDKTDLQYVLVQGVTAGFGPEGVDPRRRTGQEEPALLGSVFLLWDGDGPAYVSVELDNPIGSYYDDNGRSYSLPRSQGVVGTVRLGQIPEPGTGMLMGVGTTILFFLRRRARMGFGSDESIAHVPNPQP